MQKKIGCLSIATLALLIIVLYVCTRQREDRGRESNAPSSTPRTFKVDIKSLAAKTRAQLVDVFPGTSETLEDFKGWKEVLLFFNAKKKLAYVCFIPKSPISPEEAEHVATSELAIELKYSYYSKSRATRGYWDMPGVIKSVSFRHDIPNSEDLVAEITVTFNIGWDE